MKKITFLTIIASVLLLSSCEKKVKWYSDLNDAKKAASKQKKDIYLLFSGDDWTDNSRPFKENICETEDFANTFAKEFVLVNLDFSQENYAKIDVAEDASEAEKKAAAKIREEYEVKEKLTRVYNVREFPTAFLITSEGYVLQSLPCDSSVESAAVYYSMVADNKPKAAEIKMFIEGIKQNKGIEKVRAIDSFVNSVDGRFVETCKDLIAEVLVLDPENESGLLGAYELKSAYFDAFDVMANAREDEEFRPDIPFINVIEKGHLEAEDVQHAYYIAAYVLSQSQNPDLERMLDYLQKAYDSDPENQSASEIKSMIDDFQQMKEIMAAQNQGE